MNELEKIQKEYDDRAKEIAQTKEDMAQMGLDITASALLGVVKSFNEGIETIIKDSKDKKYFDETIGDKIKDLVDKFITAISNQKPPEINFTPNISVDINPVVEIANEIRSQNATMIVMMNRMSAAEEGSEKYNALLTVTMGVIGQTNEFLKKGLKHFDYTDVLKSISDKLSPNEKPEKLVLKRGDYNLVTEIVPVYKTI